MTLVTLLSVWGVSLVLTVAVILYAARLGRNEEEQIFLAESSNHERLEQEAIAARLSRIQPVKRGLLVFAGAMTILIVVYFVIDVFHSSRSPGRLVLHHPGCAADC